MRSHSRFVISFVVLLLGWQLVARANELNQSLQPTTTDAKDESDSGDAQTEESATKEKVDQAKNLPRALPASRSPNTRRSTK
jgi:hypothetical protein